MSQSDEDLKGSEPETTETTEPTPTPAPTGGGRGILIVSVAAVVVLIVAGVVVYLLTSGDDSSDNAAQARDVPTITGSPAPTTPADPTTSAASVAPPATVTGEVDAAESLAKEAAAAISTSDVDTLNKLSCDPASPATEDTFPADAKAKVVGDPKIEGDTATVDIELTIANSDPTIVPMPLTRQDGRWCIPS